MLTVWAGPLASQSSSQSGWWPVGLGWPGWTLGRGLGRGVHRVGVRGLCCSPLQSGQMLGPRTEGLPRAPDSHLHVRPEGLLAIF